MASFFKLFPRIEYNGSVQTNIATSFIINQALINTNTIQKYTLKDGDTPQTVAKDIYGNVKNYWVLMLINNVINPYTDWLMDRLDLENYTEKKYKEGANGLHHFYSISKGGPVDDITTRCWKWHWQHQDYINWRVVTGVRINDGGAGYTKPPLVEFEGGTGQGATARTVVDNENFYDIDTTAIRSGDPGTIFIDGSEYSGDDIYEAAAMANESGHQVLVLFNILRLVTNTLDVDFSCSYTLNKAVITRIAPLNVVQVIVTNTGTHEYSSPPVVKIVPQKGDYPTRDADCDAILGKAREIYKVTLDNPGENYNTEPKIELIEPYGMGGIIRADIDMIKGTIKRMTVMSAGSGYINPPQVKFIGGGGRGAQASIELRDPPGTKDHTVYDVTPLPQDLIPITNLNYEIEENEKRREIIIINPAHIDKFLNSFEMMMENKLRTSIDNSYVIFDTSAGKGL